MDTLDILSFDDLTELSMYAHPLGILYIHAFEIVPDMKFIDTLGTLAAYEKVIGMRVSDNKSLYTELARPRRVPCLSSWAGGPLMSAYKIEEIQNLKEYSKKTYCSLFGVLRAEGKLPAEWVKFDELI